MSGWQGVYLHDIAEELKNIREILEKQISLSEDGNETGRLDFVKKTIEAHIDDALCGIYFTRNIVGDQMAHIDKRFGIDIEICYSYEYFEIFGLTVSEQKTIASFYDRLSAARRNK